MATRKFECVKNVWSKDDRLDFTRGFIYEQIEGVMIGNCQYQHILSNETMEQCFEEIPVGEGSSFKCKLDVWTVEGRMAFTKGSTYTSYRDGYLQGNCDRDYKITFEMLKRHFK